MSNTLPPTTAPLVALHLMDEAGDHEYDVWLDVVRHRDGRLTVEYTNCGGTEHAIFPDTEAGFESVRQYAAGMFDLEAAMHVEAADDSSGEKREYHLALAHMCDTYARFMAWHSDLEPAIDLSASSLQRAVDTAVAGRPLVPVEALAGLLGVTREAVLSRHRRGNLAVELVQVGGATSARLIPAEDIYRLFDLEMPTIRRVTTEVEILPDGTVRLPATDTTCVA